MYHTFFVRTYARYYPHTCRQLTPQPQNVLFSNLFYCIDKVHICRTPIWNNMFRQWRAWAAEMKVCLLFRRFKKKLTGLGSPVTLLGTKKWNWNWSKLKMKSLRSQDESVWYWLVRTGQFRYIPNWLTARQFLDWRAMKNWQAYLQDDFGKLQRIRYDETGQS